MLKQFRQRYHGANIAVIGSAPSARQWQGTEDVAIGVNGAARLLRAGDYFFSAHESAHAMPYYQKIPPGVAQVLRAISGIYSRALYPDDGLRTDLISSYEQFLDTNMEKTYILPEGTGLRTINVLEHPGLTEEFTHTVPDAAAPHAIIRAWNSHLQIEPNQEGIRVGGTSAACAAQLAFIMGAAEIHLYGVELSNPSTAYRGQNYFFKPLPGERGVTNEVHRQKMDEILAEISAHGTSVYAHGPTALQNVLPL